MNDLDAYRLYLCRLYNMPEELADQWNVTQVPAWFVERFRRAEHFPAFLKKRREAFAEAERRWPR